jgi:hypothetical protein
MVESVVGKSPKEERKRGDFGKLSHRDELKLIPENARSELTKKPASEPVEGWFLSLPKGGS